MAIFDSGTCRIDQVSLAGSAIGAPRSRQKSTPRCDEDLRQVRLMSEGASSASDLESEGVEATFCVKAAARSTMSSAPPAAAAQCAGCSWRPGSSVSRASRRCAHRVRFSTSSARARGILARKSEMASQNDQNKKAE